jgi:hypothetical protein
MKYNLKIQVSVKSTNLYLTEMKDIDAKRLLSELRWARKKMERIDKKFEDPKNRETEKYLRKYYAP